MLLLALLLSAQSSFALDQIVRPYQSTRSGGMGGVRITTGIFDENFFNNPARVTANPYSRLTLLQVTPIETTRQTADTLSSILNKSDALDSVIDMAGTNLHGRTQIVLPAYYLTSNEERKFAFALGFIASVQGDGIIRDSYQISFSGYADVGPALTIGQKMFNDALSIGMTGHLMYRVGSDPNYSLTDYVSGVPISLESIGGEGSMFDADFGFTLRALTIAGFDLTVAGAVQNVLGGKYKNLDFRPAGLTYLPQGQPRSYGLGASISRETFLIFGPTVVAAELTDIGNNAGGSFYRLVHIGAETHFLSIFAIRAGLNQGYPSFGLGLNLRLITLDASTWGEEMTLNAGGFQDRRYSLTVGLHL